MFRWQFTRFVLRNKLGEHRAVKGLVWTFSVSVCKIMDKDDS